jgi:predicted RNase H-like nuclease
VIDPEVLFRFERRVRDAIGRGALELTIDFEQDTRSARLAVRDASAEDVAGIQLDSPEELTAVLARLVVLGYETCGLRKVPAPPPPPRHAARAPTDVLAAGVDGYGRGWVAVSVDPSGDVEVSVHSTIVEVLALRAAVIAIDIPIDPTGRGARSADSAARAFVGPRSSSVFPTPPRAALQARTFADANEIARTITGKGISQQAFALAKKILEVHELADVDERLIEMHPEVSFCALAGAPLALPKRAADGLAHRRELLLAAGIALPAAFAGVPEADLLDAAVGAWTAARYARGEARPFPAGHVGRLGAIWA